MNKQIALYVMLGGVALSLYDAMADGNPLYGVGKPLESMRWKVYTTKPTDGTQPKDYYVSISDIAALAGAYFYFRGKR